MFSFAIEAQSGAARAGALATPHGRIETPAFIFGIEPLCALYRPRAIAALETQLRRGDLALHHLAEADLEIRYLDLDSLLDLGDPRDLFANVNTQDDLRRLESGAPRRPERA